jgi:NADH-quinone oxidoreductase subunit N
MISLAYYLRVIAAMWMREAPRSEELGALRPAMAGGSQEADDEEQAAGDTAGSAELASTETDRPVASHPEITAVAVLFGAASLVLGIIPSPLFDLARDAGRSIGLL